MRPRATTLALLIHLSALAAAASLLSLTVVYETLAGWRAGEVPLAPHGTRYDLRTPEAPADEAERAHLRGQALAWLRADLTAWGALARRDDQKVLQAVQGTLRHWREDPDLTGVRDADALDKLPEDERDAWRKLWADVDALLAEAAPPK